MVATLRIKATLEASLAAANDRHRVHSRALASIDVLTRSAMGAEALREAVRAELDKLPAMLANIEARSLRDHAAIEARAYPDENTA